LDKVKNILRQWIPLAAAITVVCGLVFAAVQQSQRRDANSPQIQMAEDAASALAGGVPMDSVIPSAKVNIAHSLAPFLILYDNAGGPLASSASLNGSVPGVPSGVLESTRVGGQNRVSWEPAPGIRIAAVVTHYAGPGGAGFVLAGRSLREVEANEAATELIAGAAWLAGLTLTLFAVAAVEFLLAPRKQTGVG
jgi:hypothetical protein